MVKHLKVIHKSQFNSFLQEDLKPFTFYKQSTEARLGTAGEVARAHPHETLPLCAKPLDVCSSKNSAAKINKVLIREGRLLILSNNILYTYE